MLNTKDNAYSHGRRSILYLMHGDWCAIKQRPQFLAEELATLHRLKVLYPPSMRRLATGLSCTSSSARTAPLLPTSWRWPAVSDAMLPLQRQWVAAHARRFRPDILWLTFPTLLEMVPDALLHLPLVYDCMDDALGFDPPAHLKARLPGLEQRLVTSAGVILCSSPRLKQVMIERYGSVLATRIVLVQNAVSHSFLKLAQQSSTDAGTNTQHSFKIGYFGTISHWFDFAAILATLDAHPSVEFHLIGPNERASSPSHPRLSYYGAVPHEQLIPLTSTFNALIMPFQVTPLIQAVDPVKLYEYLALGKEVISVHYPGIDRFGDNVHFYNTPEQCARLVGALVNNTLALKNPPHSSAAFLEQNTWRHRRDEVAQVLRTAC